MHAYKMWIFDEFLKKVSNKTSASDFLGNWISLLKMIVKQYFILAGKLQFYGQTNQSIKIRDDAFSEPHFCTNYQLFLRKKNFNDIVIASLYCTSLRLFIEL